MLGLHLCVATAHAQKLAPEPAADDDEVTEIGGFVGVHTFSTRSTLGVSGDRRQSIASATALGLRFSLPLLSLLAIEGELPLIPTTTRDGDTIVLVTDPRVHARVGGGKLFGVEPFAVIGVGLPVALSTDRDVMGHDVTTSLHAGTGLRIPRKGGWNLRVEARTEILPGRGVDLAAFDFEVALGLYRAWDEVSNPSSASPRRRTADDDDDGIPDARDSCPDRDEDLDGIEDQDGCPDIDDDRDEILDQADACRLAAETTNGYRDSDGCPDELPAALAVLVPDPRALTFRSGSAQVRTSARKALTRVARVLAQYPDVRVLIAGHTDDREAPADAAGLSLRRAEAVRDVLVELGVSPQRLELWGGAAAHPRAGNETSRGRAQNRRVTLQILRPDASIASQVESASSPPPPPAR
jgi:outer membrane protein OmpA-like peptidoglycan-associated protein